MKLRNDSKVMASYARKDANIVRRAVTALRAHGVNIWIDIDDIQLGARWQDSVEVAIDQCTHMIVFLSSNSISSAEVEAEWSLALSLGKTTVPVLIEDVTTPFRLRMYQGADIIGDNFDAGIERLAAHLPVRRLPSHWLAPAGAHSVPPGHVMITISNNVTVVLDPNRFATIGQLLDTIYMDYLVAHYEPYTYGRDWCIRDRDLAVIPIESLLEPSGLARQIAPAWMERQPNAVGLWPRRSHGPLEVGAVRRDEDSLLGVASDQIELVRLLSENPKAVYQLRWSRAVSLDELRSRPRAGEVVLNDRFGAATNGQYHLYVINDGSPVVRFLRP